MTALSIHVGTDGAEGLPFFVASWYALRCLSNRERSVGAALRRAGLESFVPSYSETVRWSDRTKTTERLLFPGYVFVRLAPRDLPQALALSGVISVLPSNLRPIAISENEIENVRLVLSSPARVTPAPAVPGDKVLVKTGPMKGASGVVVRNGRGVRLIVAVAMLGRGVSVELDAADLVKESCH